MRPIPYGPLRRLADWYHGWRDGWAGIPGRPPRGSVSRPVNTPHREALLRIAQDAFQQERLVHETDRAEVSRRIADASARLHRAEAALAWARQRLADASRPLTVQEATRRRLGEKEHDENVIVVRRSREHRRRIAEAETEVRRLHNEAASAEAEIAVARVEASRHLRVAEARVRRIHEHTHRRLAVYRRRLIRVHPYGAWVNEAMSVRHPEIPGWALPESQGPADLRAPSGHGPEEDPQPPAEAPPVKVIRLGKAVTTFGSDPRDDIVLTELVAAPRHFTLARENGGLRLRARGHGNGPYIGGEPVVSAALAPDDHFDFGDRRYTVLNDRGLEDAPLGSCDLIVAGIYAKSGAKARLTDMSFVQRERTLLAILGPSGAGKSSLFSALLGELGTEEGGRLFFLGLDLAKHAGQIRAHLGFVAQDIHLHEVLTVLDLLRYEFRLRSPAPRDRRESRIAEVCAQLGLTAQVDQRVATLSGGQRRRVSIAVELLTEPRLLMLDEPTSGLDPGMDREVMAILREYAEAGNTVIVVTHATEHLGWAHQLLVVVEDGRPVFSGPPRQARRRLGFRSYADLMRRLTERPRFFADAYARTGAVAEAFREADRAEAGNGGEPRLESPGRGRGQRIRVFPRQLRVMIRRQWGLLLAGGTTTCRRDRSPWEWARGVAVTLMPLIVAALSAVLAGVVTEAPGLRGGLSGTGPMALSLLTTLCMLSAQALTYNNIVTEYPPIIRREHRTGTVTLAVTLSKWLVFSVVAVLQAIVIASVYRCFDLGPVNSVMFSPAVELTVDLAMLGVTSMTFGMLISVVARRQEQAVTVATAASIAQIAFNGVTADLSQDAVLNAVAWVLPSRWGLAAASSSADLRRIGAVPGAEIHEALWTHSRSQWLWDLSVLGLLTIVFFTLATWLLNRRLAPRPGRIAKAAGSTDRPPSGATAAPDTGRR